VDMVISVHPAFSPPDGMSMHTTQRVLLPICRDRKAFAKYYESDIIRMYENMIGR
jgi:hypothetical protein